MKLLAWLLLTACCFLNVVQCQGEYDDSGTDPEPAMPDYFGPQGGQTPQQARELRQRLYAVQHSAMIVSQVKLWGFMVGGGLLAWSLGSYIMDKFVAVELIKGNGLGYWAGTFGAICLTSAGTFVVMGLFAVGISWIVKKIKGKTLHEKIKALSKPATLTTISKEVCKDMNNLALTAEQSAEEHYGVENWLHMWKTFETLFEIAQNRAHQIVVGRVMNIPVESWPIPPPLPVQQANSTQEMKEQFNQELLKWTDDNLFTVYYLKQGIQTNYTEMHFDELLLSVYDHSNHTTFVDDPAGFQKLSDSFVLRVSLPSYCLRLVNEPHPTRLKMANMRQNVIERDSRLNHTIYNYFQLRSDMSKLEGYTL